MNKKFFFIFMFFFSFIFLSNPSYAWWNTSWARCRNITFTDNLIVVNRTFNPVYVNLTGLNLSSGKYYEIRIVNAPCGQGGNEIPYMAFPSLTNNSTWALVGFEVNKTYGVDTVYSVYYDNPQATNPNYNYVVFSDNFNRTSNIFSRIGVGDDYHFYNEGTAALNFNQTSIVWIRGSQYLNWTIKAPTSNGHDTHLYLDFSRWATKTNTPLSFSYSFIWNDTAGQNGIRAGANIHFYNNTIHIYEDNQVTSVPVKGIRIGEISYNRTTGFNPNYKLVRADGSTGVILWDSGKNYENDGLIHNVSLIFVNSTTWNLTIDGSFIGLWSYPYNWTNWTIGLELSGNDETVEYYYIDNICVVSAFNRTCNVYDTDLIYSIGAEELAISNQPPQITISLPVNTTYWYANNFQFSFKATDDNSTAFQLKAFLDSSLIYNNSSYQNNTQINLIQNLSLPKQYNFTVWANDTQGATSSLTVIFTIKDFEIQQITYNSVVYETTTQSFTETIRVNFDLVSNITSNLFWNSTDKGSCSQNVNSTHIILFQAIDIPLVQTNDTAISFFFRNYITYTNTSSTTVDSASNNQSIIYSYIPQNIVLGDNFLEYDDIKPTLNITILYNNSQTQFSYLWNLTNNTNYKTASEASPTIINFENYLANETRSLTLTLNISFQNSSRVYNFSKNFTSYMTMLTNCSYLSTTQTLSFIFKDEETQNTLSPMNYTYISIYVSPQNLRKQRFYDFTNLQNICIYPSWATYFANVSAIARKDNYAVATHVPYQTSVLTNSSQTITVYLIPLSVSSPITFTLPGSNYIFVAERQYGSNFVYIRSDLSDFNRKIIMYLRPYDTYYRITIYSEIGKLCFASSGFKVASSTYEITSCTAITNISYPSPWYQKNINYTCTKTQIGNITNVKCDFYALDNLDHDFYLIVYKYNEPWGKTLYSNQTLHAISGSLSVDLGEGAYDVYLYAHSDPDYLWTDFVNNKVLIVSAEIFFFLLLFYCLSCVVGWFNPFIGLLFNIIITFIASFLGLATFPQQAIAGLTILFIFAIIFTREWK